MTSNHDIAINSATGTHINVSGNQITTSNQAGIYTGKERPGMQNLIGLDFETYGGVSLPDHGLHRYTSDRTFRPLIAATVIQGSSSWLAENYDFILDPDAHIKLRRVIEGKIICAHNAGFEQRVLHTMGIERQSSSFIDSAVYARAMGAGGHLEAAAPQLLGTQKMAEGRQLIQLFSIPGKLQEANGSLEFDPAVVDQNPDEWRTNHRYCELDAELSLRLVLAGEGKVLAHEIDNAAITMDMNNLGWPVDVKLVEEMQRRYLENLDAALETFRSNHDAEELNLNSLQQLKAWCAERGIKATSFDEKHVAKLLARIQKKMGTMTLADPKWLPYWQVLSLLETKQILGGSSLKKLSVILDTVSDDGRLRDQYLHCGAGQTLRTTGRSVQMQNLKRLSEPADMAELDDMSMEWDNTKLAENLRQVFTSSDPNGQLIVGDFASVESRGLAWLAGEDWKLSAYRRGEDVYETLARTIYGYGTSSLITKPERNTGKVGELSCGYGAGGSAVQAFAEGMGITMTEAEAAKLVYDWRDACPHTVELWSLLNEGLLTVVGTGKNTYGVALSNGQMVRLLAYDPPASLLTQHPGSTTVEMQLLDPRGQLLMQRYFHGCYMRGRDVCYYKPSSLKGGDLWSSTYTDPKTKEVKFHKLYGGKLAGILTQSLCREIFFHVLREVDGWVKQTSNVQLIGQFHDEIVLDWQPGGTDLRDVKASLEASMSNEGIFAGFPLAAEVKSDYRYIK